MTYRWFKHREKERSRKERKNKSKCVTVLQVKKSAIHTAVYQDIWGDE